MVSLLDTALVLCTPAAGSLLDLIITLRSQDGGKRGKRKAK